MAFEFAQVIAQLADAVVFIGEMEVGDNGLMDLLGGPAADVGATVQEDFEQADDARIMELDAGIADCADGDGARRCSSGKSTWTLSHCAWKPAKRSVMVWNRSRTAWR